MTSFWVYIIVEIPVPLFIALLVSIGVGLVGCHALEPNKLVRIMFLFLKRNPAAILICLASLSSHQPTKNCAIS